ncbi:hypothetical protein RAZWK3B_12502 [Roseobacter sp. AzwK-3b]|uniref:Uncharacterized protein n=1 Tax=Roseovarius litoreus TaxID=1155722 RepID=A0A1M7C3E2_9RHOB|nr:MULTISPECIES: hypothetical protein [Roseobacteraceae]EDM69471.1 hypothetical protein RAZWK3B_12502 [Roseobacter sp. AzwK-3b]SHL61812.1 hypothetical protein SAMN05443432_10219 [Roseovarius litoreus]
MAVTICRMVVIGITALYLFALAYFVIGTYGLFGQAPNPLAGVFLLPLGLPWSLLLTGLPETVRPWALVAAPLLNIAFFTVMCRRTAARVRAGKN